MERAEIVARLRAQEAALKSRGVEHLAMFGSRARGDAREDSDLDLLLDVPQGRRFSLFDLLRIERRLGEELGIPVAAVMRRSLKPSFARRIGDDVVEIF